MIKEVVKGMKKEGMKKEGMKKEGMKKEGIEMYNYESDDDSVSLSILE